MAVEYRQPTTLWNKGFLLLFIANLFMHMGQQTITTLVPKYASAMGAAATIVGIASSAFAISALLSKPFTSPAPGSRMIVAPSAKTKSRRPFSL